MRRDPSACELERTSRVAHAQKMVSSGTGFFALALARGGAALAGGGAALAGGDATGTGMADGDVVAVVAPCGTGRVIDALGFAGGISSRGTVADTAGAVAIVVAVVPPDALALSTAGGDAALPRPVVVPST